MNTTTYAIDLMKILVEALPIDILVNSKLIPTILAAIDRKDNLILILDLLSITLTVIERQISASNRKSLLKSIGSLNTVAAKVAQMILDIPKAGSCLCSLLRIFTPMGSQSEVLSDSAFHSFSIVLSQGCRKPEHCSVLSEIVRNLQLSVENSTKVKLRLRGSGTLIAALRKASEYGSDELKNAALACQRAIRS
jgi:hypothetical protein